MSAVRLHGWPAVLVTLVAGLIIACSGRKQVPFGLEDAGTAALEPDTELEEPGELHVGVSFGPDQVEVPVAESTFVLKSGYALAALGLELDGREPTDALVVSADPAKVRLHAVFARGLNAVGRRIDSFAIPEGCSQPRGEVRQLSATLVGARVDLACEGGPRTDWWLVTIEAQPRSRERITALPPNASSNVPLSIELTVEDRDADGYEDAVANVEVVEITIPLTWLDRPGGFARDASQPEAALREQADAAWGMFRSDPRQAGSKAFAVIDAYRALCQEGRSARIALSGAEGLQCQRSPATARAVSVAMASAIRRGELVRALELQRWWEEAGAKPTPEEQEIVQTAWRAANANRTATWRSVDTEGSRASLYFRDDDTLVVDCRAPRTIDLSSGKKTRLASSEVTPAARDPEGRYAVRGVRATCAGFEAEVTPVGSKQSHRISIERRSDGRPCGTAIDREASVFDWAVLGWAPQGLLAASGDLLRIIPLNAFAKPAGKPIDLTPGSPLPAPIRGARITTDGTRYVIPHREGVFIRDWRRGRSGLWLRPADWSTVPGELRSLAISPSGHRVAVQKGSDIRVLTW